MATRKGGDGSHGMDASGGDRPGSYAKSSGSRRKRKGKRGDRSTVPPAPSASVAPAASEHSVEQAIDDALDVFGEEVETNGRARLTQPDWGAAVSDNSIDDLRRKPTSSRAPRKQLGPLGMEEAAVEGPSSSPPRRPSTPRPAAPSGRMNVVEINPGEQTSDNTNNDAYEPSHDPFGDPFEDDPEERRAALPGNQASYSTRPSRRPESDQLALNDAWRAADAPAHPSMSSVFGARPSLRPSPPPPAARSVSVLWWFVVSLLTGIIVAAGVTAMREAKRQKETARAPLAPSPAVVEEPTPSLARGPTPVALPAPQAAPAEAAPAPVAAPAVAKWVPGQPTTASLTPPAPKPSPVVATPPAARPEHVPTKPLVASGQAPVVARPRAPRAAPEVEAPEAPAAAAKAGEPAPVDEHLPENPYN